MEPILFFLAGLPLAFLLNGVITRFGRAYAEEEYDDSVKQLPWQRQPFNRYVRLACVLSLPPLFALSAARFDLLAAVAVSLFVAGLIVCTATDLLHYRVPNAVTYPAIPLALLAAAVLPDGDLSGALIAALAGGLAFLIMAIVTRGGIGLGDVKLAVMIGAGLGFPAAYQSIMAGVIVGGIIIILFWLAGIVSRKQSVPYAPFLAIAAVVFALHTGTSFATF